MTISDRVFAAIGRLRQAGFEPTSISMDTVPAMIWASELGLTGDPKKTVAQIFAEKKFADLPVVVHHGAANVVNGSRSGQPDGRDMVEVEPILLDVR